MSMIGYFLRVGNKDLETYLEDSALLENRLDLEEENETGNLISIEASWEGILFLLTGQNLGNLDHPLGRFFFSGQTVDDDQDLGYGPAHYLDPAQVKELSLELSAITPQQLASRFDASRMTELEIYPGGWDNKDAGNFLTDYFKDVQDFYGAAAENNEAVITFIS